MADGTTTQALSIAAQAGLPVMLWGMPGEGKTSTIRAMSKSIGAYLEVFIGATRDPADIGGFPSIGDQIKLGDKIVTPTTRSVPGFFSRLYREAEENDYAIWFVDELTSAPPAVQAALMNILLEGEIEDLRWPENVLRVAAANPPDVAAAGWDLAPPMANRLVHLDWSLSSDTFCDGMLQGWPTPSFVKLPANWKDKLGETRALVSSFIRALPRHKSNLPEQEDARGRAWPSPRTWDYASRAMAACRAAGIEKPFGKVETMLIAGCVGTGVAHEFREWVKEMDIPDPEKILADPTKAMVPDRGDRILATCNSVAAAAIDPGKRGETVKGKQPEHEQRWLACWTYLDRVATAQGKDLVFPAARLICRSENRPVGVLPPKLVSRLSDMIVEVRKAVEEVK